jgi:hypothetical protein
MDRGFTSPFYAWRHKFVRIALERRSMTRLVQITLDPVNDDLRLRRLLL